MGLADIEAAARRLLILQALADDADYSISHMVLIGLLGEYNYASTDVRRDIAWLEEHGLISTQAVGPASMPESTITRLGEDVARGRTTIPGVRRPRRGE